MMQAGPFVRARSRLGTRAGERPDHVADAPGPRAWHRIQWAWCARFLSVFTI